MITEIGGHDPENTGDPAAMREATIGRNDWSRSPRYAFQRLQDQVALCSLHFMGVRMVDSITLSCQKWPPTFIFESQLRDTNALKVRVLQEPQEKKVNAMRPLEFGWFLPTAGDTTAYADRNAGVAPSLEMFDRVVAAAEGAGFEYLLVPVASSCWDAYVTSAMMLARSRKIRMLLAARPGYMKPVLLARMISAMDQLSGGRVSVNLIAGQSDDEAIQDGIELPKDQRYELMDEEVVIMKSLWTSPDPVHFEGAHHRLHGARIAPKPLQKPHPRFYLGGASVQAWEVSARHADVHLFWGDTVERITANMNDIRQLAVRHGREKEIGFGMRLQMVCRETEDEAWSAANALVAGVTEGQTAFIQRNYASSQANRRVQELARTYGDLIAPHLWTGITKVRPGAGIAVVGNPRQCADTLQQFIDIGCQSFCLSGYLHDEEAERFARLVRPLLVERNGARMPALAAAAA